MQGVLYFFLLFSLTCATEPSTLRTEFEWKYFDYAWKSQEQKNQFIKTGKYDFKKIIQIDVDQSAGNFFFFFFIKINIELGLKVKTYSTIKLLRWLNL